MHQNDFGCGISTFSVLLVCLFLFDLGRWSECLWRGLSNDPNIFSMISFCCLTAETIQGRKLFVEIRSLLKLGLLALMLFSSLELRPGTFVLQILEPCIQASEGGFILEDAAEFSHLQTNMPNHYLGNDKNENSQFFYIYRFCQFTGSTNRF